MTDIEKKRATPGVRGLRRAAIIVVVAALVIAGGIGILALLSGEFGDTQARILLTTLVVATFGLTALCHLAIAGQRFRVVGYVGIVASVAALVPALVLVWYSFGDGQSSSDWYRALWVLTVLAITLAQANLLLRLASSARAIIRIGLVVTLVAAGVVAIMLWLPILTNGDIPGDNSDYWRLFGVVAIVDVIGTIALPIIGLVLRAHPHEAAEAAPPDERNTPLSIVLPPDLLARLDSAAAATGTDRAGAALAALDRGLAPGTAESTPTP